MSAGKQEEGPVPGAAGGVPGAAGGVAGGASASGGDAGPGTHVHLTHEPLDLAACVAAVASPRAGATSTFIGTTRDNFDGRNVVLLEYEAYVRTRRAAGVAQACSLTHTRAWPQVQADGDQEAAGDHC